MVLCSSEQPQYLGVLQDQLPVTLEAKSRLMMPMLDQIGTECTQVLNMPSYMDKKQLYLLYINSTEWPQCRPNKV